MYLKDFVFFDEETHTYIYTTLLENLLLKGFKVAVGSMARLLLGVNTTSLG